ncbi:50S ribosomal protein L18 [Candidatus Woesearchaeota archaeon]|nr:50S ribosomal protein L18 [Candidatus Woesearchaeota archaeon]
MANNATYSVPYRRKRDGKTDYKKRMKLLLGRKTRLVVRRSSKHFSVQLVEFHVKGDKIVCSAHSKELVKYGWKGSTSNSSAAYLTGLLIAKKVKTKVECVLDLGQQVSVKGSVLYALAKGAIDGGLQLSCSKEVIPSEARIRGEHVASLAKALKANKEKYAKQFAKYIKEGIDPASLPDMFDKVKAKIGAV